MIHFFNNTYSPFSPFDLQLFIILEIVTVIIESSVLWFLFRDILKTEKNGKLVSISYIDFLGIALVINMISAILGIFIWSLLGVGI
jgi:hypothetical protein